MAYSIIQISDTIGNIFSIENDWKFNYYKLNSSLIEINISLSEEELVFRLDNGFDDINKIKMGRINIDEIDLCRTIKVVFTKYEIYSSDNNNFTVSLFFTPIQII